MAMFKLNSIRMLGVGAVLALGLGGCGGGGGGGSDADDGGGTPAPTATSTIHGVAMAGPFSSGQVCAYAVTSSGTQGDQLACASINPADSSFSLTISDYVGGVVMSILSGTYDDEATPGVDATALTEALRSFVTVDGNTINVAITPLTEAAIRMAGTFDFSAIQAEAQQLMAAYGLGSSGVNLFNTLPDVEAGNAAEQTYREALAILSGMQFTSGQSLADYLDEVAAADPGAYSQQVRNYINNYLPSNCSFANGNFVCDVPDAGGGSGGGSGNGGGTGVTGNYDLTLTVTTSMGVPVPAVTINDIPKPNTQDEFCNDPTAMAQIDALNSTAGATLTINSCSFSGNAGVINATVSITNPISMTINYTANYLYTAN